MWRRARGPLAGAAALAACWRCSRRRAAVLDGDSDDDLRPDRRSSGWSPRTLREARRLPPREPRPRPGDRRGLLRQTFDWRRIERAPGRYDLSFYDGYVAALARRRLRVLPILFNPPPFRSSAPANPVRGTYPPRRPADMGEFGAMLARRYGPGGSFWRERPELPRLPVRSWQVWNEPNLPVYWPSGPDAAEYVALLRPPASASERGPGRGDRDRRAARQHRGVPLRDYVGAMYAAGAAGTFDVLALNLFGRDARETIEGVRSLREVAAASGDNPAVWLTELGDRRPTERAFLVSEARQAELLERTCSRWRAGARAAHSGVVYFNWRDSLPYAGGVDFFGLHTGLLRRNGRAKPALSAYKKVAKTLGLMPD